MGSLGALDPLSSSEHIATRTCIRQEFRTLRYTPYPALGLALASSTLSAQTTPASIPPTPIAPSAGGSSAPSDTDPTTPPPSTPVTLTFYDRQRVNATQWFAATPHSEVYGYGEFLLRIALAQRIRHFDWQAELSQSTEFALPTDAVSPVPAQGQLGLGGTVFASNANNNYPVAASFKTGWLRYHLRHDRTSLRLGRFEFLDGAETVPTNATLAWLQSNRIAQRLIGNFGFSNGQRSLDGVDGHLARRNWDLTAMAARADQGVFNMNANPELNVDVQYLAYTRYLANGHVQMRGFAIGFHDGRTGITKTDNRPLTVRQLDHRNIRIGTYGGNVATAIPLSPRTTLDLLFWGVLQNGQWGLLNQHSGAALAEAGLRFNAISSRPWVRVGFFRSTGDNNPIDSTHNTFFQLLPTPRNYARFPFFNQMNSSEQFLQLIDAPTKRLNLRSDLHFLQLTSARDLWYQGGGAFNNKVFGYTGRPANLHTSFASLYDASADYILSPNLSLSAFYGIAFGKSVIAAIYPRDRNAQFGFFEFDYRVSRRMRHAAP